MQQTPTNNLPGLLAGLSAAAIWGGMYVVSKVVLEVIPPFALLTSRLVLGFLALWLVIAWRGGFSLNKSQLIAAFGVGIVGYGISLGFQFVGTKLSTAANGSLVTSATPALVLPFAWLLLKEPVTTRRLIAILIASLGVLAVIDPRKADWNSDLFLGNLALLGAALTWALYSVLVRKVIGAGSNLLQASAIFLLGGLPIAIPLAVWELSGQGMGPITPAILAGILFLGIIATAIAMFLWNYAFAQLPAASASLTFFAQPVVGTLLGWFFLGEKITPFFILGGILIGASILISARGE
ncbi:MAG: DMT family transporter [Anaerolineales bacterium]|jgi:drug/metabolite transporter (DMT)-like permease|nr:DMT family transporter [Anaerolineales bacterium]